MKNLYLLVYSICFSLLVNCGGDSSQEKAALSQNSGAQGAKAQVQSSLKVNGKTPSAYYNQFLFKIKKSKDPSGWDFSQLVKNTKDVSLTEKDMFADFDLALHEDGTYHLAYSEQRERPADPEFGGREFEGIRSIVKTGKWKLDGANIVISGLGTGTPLEYKGAYAENEVPAFRLTFNGDLHSKGLKGKAAIFTVASSSSTEQPTKWKGYDNESK